MYINIPSHTHTHARARARALRNKFVTRIDRASL